MISHRARRRIETLLRGLAAQPDTPRVTNPYRNAALRRNLQLYLEYFRRQRHVPLLLVGEALGYRGGLLTGIPFSSGAVFQRDDHPLLREIGPQLQIERIESEPTATIAWNCFIELGMAPLCWNAYPFHPHPEGELLANRAPTAEEIASQQDTLRQLIAIFQPDRVVGVGNRGYECATQALPGVKIAKSRHPSHGGKQAFVRSLRALAAKRAK